MKLRDPEECPVCHCRRYRLVDSRRRGGPTIGYYRRRVHRCKECGQRWRSFISTINPKHISAA